LEISRGGRGGLVAREIIVREAGNRSNNRSLMFLSDWPRINRR
jgi:hypothetical protein